MHHVLYCFVFIFSGNQIAGKDGETHRGNVFRRELVCGVGDEQTGFTHSTVPDYNTLNGLHSCLLQSSLLIQDLQEKQKKKTKTKTHTCGPSVTLTQLAATITVISDTFTVFFLITILWRLFSHVTLQKM